MRVMGWIFRIALNLVMLAVVYSIFEVAHSQFETIVVCILILIYVSVSFTNMSVMIKLSEVEKTSYSRFLTLRALAGQPSDDNERERLDSFDKQLTEPGYWVNVGGLSIVSLWTMWYLVATVMSANPLG